MPIHFDNHIRAVSGLSAGLPVVHLPQNRTVNGVAVGIWSVAVAVAVVQVAGSVPSGLACSPPLVVRWRLLPLFRVTGT